MFSNLNRISKRILNSFRFIKIAHRKPIWYGSIYLLLIPVFAMIYTFVCPSEFAHTNLKYEKSHQSELINVLWGAKKLLKNNIKEYSSDKSIERSIGLESLEYMDNYFTFSLIVHEKIGRLEYDCRSRRALSVYPNKHHLDTPYDLPVVEVLHVTDEDVLESGPIIRLSGDSGYTDNDYLLECSIPKMYAHLTNIQRNVDSRKYKLMYNDCIEKIPGYACGERVIKSNKYFNLYENMSAGITQVTSWDTFKRMIYFSSVSITTLGFGDIVPITDRARWLVVLESVLGIIVIGLFLNAIGANRSK